MSDDSGVPSTIVKPNNQQSANNENQYCCQIAYENNKYVFKMENIKLQQNPSESLSMRVDIESYNSSFGMEVGRSTVYTQHHNYCIDLRFCNYLHEFNQNYRYEIICKLEKSDEYLFSCILDRKSGLVKSEKQYLPVTEGINLLTDLYFEVRRLISGRNDVKTDNEHIHRVISTLRNTGCDIVLRAKDGDLRAHSLILSQNSKIFQVMLSFDMERKRTSIINVSEFEGRVISKMLDFLYTGQLGNLGDMIESLFKLALRYQIHDLYRRCEEYYIFNVGVDNDNIIKIRNIADFYGLEKLNEYAENFIKNHEKELLTLPSYQQYLIKSMHLDNTVSLLLLFEKYGMEDLKMKVFDFINDNIRQMMKNSDFLDLFESEPDLTREIHVYMHRKKLLNYTIM